ncbi:MAG TPA: class IV adenylate cyclase [Pirellulales bacterium]
MAIEVEQKFAIENMESLRRRLCELGAAFGSPLEQVDLYFAHPARDFAETDEAFRLRREGEANWFTYKGPKLDRTTKTRHEIELPIAAGHAQAQQAIELATALGFRQVAAVRKQRCHSTVDWHAGQVAVALDEVEELGAFVELEIVTSSEGVDAARDAMQSLAERLGLANAERRSYLELLLAKPAGGA